MKTPLITFCIACAVWIPRAQAAPWQPSAGHEQVPIWPSSVAAGRQGPVPESTDVVVKSNVAGRPWRYVAHVSLPTLTVYPPRGNNTGAAVIVFPGGATRFSPSISRARRSATG